jgi:hypothetical protein
MCLLGSCYKIGPRLQEWEVVCEVVLRRLCWWRRWYTMATMWWWWWCDCGDVAITEAVTSCPKLQFWYRIWLSCTFCFPKIDTLPAAWHVTSDKLCATPSSGLQLATRTRCDGWYHSTTDQSLVLRLEGDFVAVTSNINLHKLVYNSLWRLRYFRIDTPILVWFFVSPQIMLPLVGDEVTSGFKPLATKRCGRWGGEAQRIFRSRLWIEARSDLRAAAWRTRNSLRGLQESVWTPLPSIENLPSNLQTKWVHEKLYTFSVLILWNKITISPLTIIKI